MDYKYVLKLLIAGLFILLYPCYSFAENITVITINDLEEPLKEIKRSFEQKYPQHFVNYIYQTKPEIITNVKEINTPADVLIIDDYKSIQYLAKGKIILPESIQVLGKDELCVVVEDYKPLRAFFLYPQTLILRGIIVGNPHKNALGEYTKEALNYFGLVKKIPEKLLYRDNNNHILSLMNRGNYDGAIMYCSYAKRTPLRITDKLNPKTHSPIKYTSGLINKSNKVKAAQSFNQFLLSTNAKEILKKYYIAF